MRLDPDGARELDVNDPLAKFRDEFVVDDAETIYLDGNSPGRLPKRTVARLREVVENEWGKRLVYGRGEGRMDAPARIGAKIAQALGAQRDAVIVANSLWVNFYKLVNAALGARAGRKQIVAETVTFSTDASIAQGRARARSVERTYVDSHDGVAIPTAAMVNALKPNACAHAPLRHPVFKNGAETVRRHLEFSARRECARRARLARSSRWFAYGPRVERGNARHSQFSPARQELAWASRSLHVLERPLRRNGTNAARDARKIARAISNGTLHWRLKFRTRMPQITRICRKIFNLWQRR